jgi:sulfate transport system permease protein
VIQDMGRDSEEAASSLGATRLQIFRKVILPTLYPALLTGFAMSFARGLGEYGSVIFIAGRNESTNIAPLEIIAMTQQHEYTAATVVAVGLLVISFVLLLAVNLLQRLLARRGGMA